MRPLPVVQLDVFAYGAPDVADRPVGLPLHLFVPDAALHALDEDVVAPASLAVHQQANTPAQHRLGERARSKLTALIGVHDIRRRSNR